MSENARKATWSEVKAMADAQVRFLRDVIAERKRQDEKWGQNFVGIDRMLVVLMEEVGEVARAQLEGDHAHACRELTEVAAVCSKMFELLDAGAR